MFLKKAIFSVAIVVSFCSSQVASSNEIERKTARTIYDLSLQTRDKTTLARAANALARLGATEAAKDVDRRSVRLSNTEIKSLQSTIFERKLAVGKIEEARRIFSETTDKNEQIEKLWALAQAEIARGNKTQARADLRRISSLSQGHFSANSRLALLFAQAGDVAAAKRIFARAEAKIRASLQKEPKIAARFGPHWESKELVGLMAQAGFKTQAIKLAVESSAPALIG